MGGVREDAPPRAEAPHAPVPRRSVTPAAFIAKWRASELKERSGSQEHFIDLCRLLGEPTPAEADPSGARYCFERGARKDTGARGWADVWKRHCFAWECGDKVPNSRYRNKGLAPPPNVRSLGSGLITRK